ncbi:MAG: hypothetical protein WBI52_07730, partial [Bacteroidales bacterium]
MKKLVMVVILFSMFFASCNSCSKTKEREFLPSIERKKLHKLYLPPIKIQRYEQDLFAIPLDSLKNRLTALYPKYSFFYRLEDLENPANLFQIKLYLT